MEIENRLLISIEEDYKSIAVAIKRLEEALYRDFVNNNDIKLYNDTNTIIDRLKSYINACNFFLNEIDSKHRKLLSAYEEVIERNEMLRNGIKLAEINQKAYKELYEKIIQDMYRVSTE